MRSSRFLADLLKRRRPFGPFQQGTLESGLVVDFRQPVGLGGRGGCSTEQHQPRPERLGQGDRDFGGDAACPSADDDQITALDRRSAGARSPPRFTTGSSSTTARPSGVRATSAGPRWNNSFTIKLGGARRRVEARGEVHGLAMDAPPLVAGCLGHPGQCARGRARFRAEPGQAERAFESRHGQEGCPAAARRIAREPVPRHGSAETRP